MICHLWFLDSFIVRCMLCIYIEQEKLKSKNNSQKTRKSSKLTFHDLFDNSPPFSTTLIIELHT